MGYTRTPDVHDHSVETAILEQRSHKDLRRTPFQVVPGVVASVAYADGDALGTKFRVPVSSSGTITLTLVSDLDKEALSIAFLLFDDDFAGGTDNSAFDKADADRDKFIGFLTVSSFQSLNDNAVGQSATVLDFVAPKRELFVQAVAKGAQNLTKSTDYGVSFVYEDHS